MKKALLVTYLSIGVVTSSAVASFVYSSSIADEDNVLVKIASYENFNSSENSKVTVNGEFKLIIGQDIETYCSINAKRVNNNNDSILNNYVGTYCFNWDSTFDSYFIITNDKGNLEDGIIIDSPTIVWKDAMRPLTKEEHNRLETVLIDKEISITFLA